jgi:uncharacterized SAM-binding protein YcdF (DUF218 family)
MSPPPAPVATRFPCRILGRTVLVLFVLAGILLVAGWFERAPLLRAVAAAWIVSDKPGPADAAVVLGGGIEDRPFAAAEYYRAGLVKKVLVSNVRLGPAQRLGVLKSDTAATCDILSKLGVPPNDVETFGTDLTNTYQEAFALHLWVERAGARTLIVPTEIFSTRRVRWMLRRVFGSGFAVYVPALDPTEYRRDDWWQHDQGIVAFQNEVLKDIYYHLKY